MSDNKCAACGQFAGRGHKCPTVLPPAQPASIRNVPDPSSTSNPHAPEVEERVSRAQSTLANQPLLPTPEARFRAAQRLESGNDSILANPAVKRGTENDERNVYEVLDDTNPHISGFVENFPGGSMVMIDRSEQGSTYVVALVRYPEPTGPEWEDTHAEVTAIVTTNDQMDADALYAGMAEELGVLGERCEGCGTPIPSVYMVCRDCA